MPTSPKQPRRKMGPEERAAARERWADLGVRLLGDVSDGALSGAEAATIGMEAVGLIAAIVRDRRDADDTPDAVEA